MSQVLSLPWLTEERLDKLKKIRSDPVFFAKHIMNWSAYSYQRNILRDTADILVARMGRQTGKTTVTAVKAVAFAFCNPDVNILIVSPGIRQSMIMFDRILDFMEGNPLLESSIVRMTRTELKLTNKSRIIALPCSEVTLRGYTAHMIIVDEAAFVPDEIITAVLIPMLATTQGYLILLSTPWGRNNFFYMACIDPKIKTYHIKSIQCPKITKKWLEKIRKLPGMTKSRFRREYDAEFEEAGNIYFSQWLIQECVKEYVRRWPGPEEKEDKKLTTEEVGVLYTDVADMLSHLDKRGTYFLGIDLGKLEDYTIIAVVRRLPDKTLKLVGLIQFELNTPYPQIVLVTKKIASVLHPKKIFVDRYGPGEAVIDDMKKEHIKNVESMGFSTKEKQAYLGTLKVEMEHLRFLFPYDTDFINQMNSQEYEYMQSGQLKFSHPRNTWDDKLWATALAVHAASGKYRGGVLIT